MLNGTPRLDVRARNLVSRVSICYIGRCLAVIGWAVMPPDTFVSNWIPSEKQMTLTCPLHSRCNRSPHQMSTI